MEQDGRKDLTSRLQQILRLASEAADKTTRDRLLALPQHLDRQIKALE